MANEKADITPRWAKGETGVIGGGGAMDLATGVRAIRVMTEHRFRAGEPKVLQRCTLPVTGLGCVKRVYTELAVLDITLQGLLVGEMVDGLTMEALQARPVPRLLGVG